jgi:hypothetical protein
MMRIKQDEDLPHSHLEGLPLSKDEPVRFVWEKTMKQSQHNAQMKTRVIADVKTNRKLYKHVPNDDFKRVTLESTFDQAYGTLRQKYRIQQDASIAHSQKLREEKKATRARRNARKRLVCYSVSYCGFLTYFLNLACLPETRHSS